MTLRLVAASDPVARISTRKSGECCDALAAAAMSGYKEILVPAPVHGCSGECTERIDAFARLRISKNYSCVEELLYRVTYRRAYGAALLERIHTGTITL